MSRAVEARLPKLLAQVRHLAYAAARMPEHAAREMEAAVKYDWRRNEDLYGQHWPETQAGHRFDPNKHVLAHWKGSFVGEDAILTNDHPAAAYLQRRYKGRPARLMRPEDGRGLGIWAKRISRMIRRLIYGSGMTAERREELKIQGAARRLKRQQAVVARRAERQAAREARRALRLQTRATRRNERAADRKAARAAFRGAAKENRQALGFGRRRENLRSLIGGLRG